MRRALAICWRISADGRRRPRSIWLRYGLEIPASSDSRRRESRAELRCSRMNEPSSLNRSGSSLTNWAPFGRDRVLHDRRPSTDARPVLWRSTSSACSVSIRSCRARRSTRHASLDGFELAGDAVQLIDVQVAEGADLVGPEDGVELGGQVGLLGVRREQHGQVTGAGRAPRAGGQDGRAGRRPERPDRERRPSPGARGRRGRCPAGPG